MKRGMLLLLLWLLGVAPCTLWAAESPAALSPEPMFTTQAIPTGMELRPVYVIEEKGVPQRIHYRLCYGPFRTSYGVSLSLENGVWRETGNDVAEFSLPAAIPAEARITNTAPYVREAQIRALLAGETAETPWAQRDYRVCGQPVELWADPGLNPFVRVGTVVEGESGTKAYPRHTDLYLRDYRPRVWRETVTLPGNGGTVAAECLRTEAATYVRVRDLAQVGYGVSSRGSLPVLESPNVMGTLAAEAVPTEPVAAAANTLSAEVQARARAAALVDFPQREETLADGLLRYWLTEQTLTPGRDRDGRAVVRVTSRYDDRSAAGGVRTAEAVYFVEALTEPAPTEAVGREELPDEEEILLLWDGKSLPVRRILQNDTNYIRLDDLVQAGLVASPFAFLQ